MRTQNNQRLRSWLLQNVVQVLLQLPGGHRNTSQRWQKDAVGCRPCRNRTQAGSELCPGAVAAPSQAGQGSWEMLRWELHLLRLQQVSLSDFRLAVGHAHTTNPIWIHETWMYKMVQWIWHTQPACKFCLAALSATLQMSTPEEKFSLEQRNTKLEICLEQCTVKEAEQIWKTQIERLS